jgi:hypothetical protein
LVELSIETGPGLIFDGRIFIIDSIELLVSDMLRYFISS